MKPFYFQELENTRNKLADAEQLISSQDKLVRDLEEKIQENSFRAAEPAAERSEGDGAEAPEEQQPTQSSAITPDPDNKQISDPLREEERLSKECKSLQELVQKLEEKNANLQVRVILNKPVCIIRVTTPGALRLEQNQSELFSSLTTKLQ